MVPPTPETAALRCCEHWADNTPYISVFIYPVSHIKSKQHKSECKELSFEILSRFNEWNLYDMIDVNKGHEKCHSLKIIHKFSWHLLHKMICFWSQGHIIAEIIFGEQHKKSSQLRGLRDGVFMFADNYYHYYCCYIPCKKASSNPKRVQCAAVHSWPYASIPSSPGPLQQ